MRWARGLIVVAIAAVVGAVWMFEQPRSAVAPDRPLPSFALSSVQDASRIITPRDFEGRVSILNFWASWCLACRDEHPLLLAVARSGRIAVYGVNFRDRREDALRWLNFYGDPYILSAFDPLGELGRDLGVDGVPQTLVIDQRGVVRYRHIGPLSDAAWKDRVLPLVDELERQAAPV